MMSGTLQATEGLSGSGSGSGSGSFVFPNSSSSSSSCSSLALNDNQETQLLSNDKKSSPNVICEPTVPTQEEEGGRLPVKKLNMNNPGMLKQRHRPAAAQRMASMCEKAPSGGSALDVLVVVPAHRLQPPSSDTTSSTTPCSSADGVVACSDFVVQFPASLIPAPTTTTYTRRSLVETLSSSFYGSKRWFSRPSSNVSSVSSSSSSVGEKQAAGKDDSQSSSSLTPQIPPLVQRSVSTETELTTASSTAGNNHYNNNGNDTVPASPSPNSSKGRKFNRRLLSRKDRSFDPLLPPSTNNNHTGPLPNGGYSPNVSVMDVYGTSPPPTTTATTSTTQTTSTSTTLPPPPQQPLVQVELNGIPVPNLTMTLHNPQLTATTNTTTAPPSSSSSSSSSTLGCRFQNGGTTKPPTALLEQLLTDRVVKLGCNHLRYVLHLPSEHPAYHDPLQTASAYTSSPLPLPPCYYVDASMHVWSSADSIIISDIDGTVTKSDVFGVVDTVVTESYSYAHRGICRLYTMLAGLEHGFHHGHGEGEGEEESGGEEEEEEEEVGWEVSLRHGDGYVRSPRTLSPKSPAQAQAQTQPLAQAQAQQEIEASSCIPPETDVSCCTHATTTGHQSLCPSSPVPTTPTAPCGTPASTSTTTRAQKGQVRFLYLTSRPISLLESTRKFLLALQQQHPHHASSSDPTTATTTTTNNNNNNNEYTRATSTVDATPTRARMARLPPGPVLCHVGSLYEVLWTELVKRNADEFKADVLVRQVVLPFAAAGRKKEQHPKLFIAGFGNKPTDARAYQKAGADPDDVYIINPRSEITCMSGGNSQRKSRGLGRRRRGRGRGCGAALRCGSSSRRGLTVSLSSGGGYERANSGSSESSGEVSGAYVVQEQEGAEQRPRSFMMKKSPSSLRGKLSSSSLMMRRRRGRGMRRMTTDTTALLSVDSRDQSNIHSSIHTNATRQSQEDDGEEQGVPQNRPGTPVLLRKCRNWCFCCDCAANMTRSDEEGEEGVFFVEQGEEEEQHFERVACADCQQKQQQQLRMQGKEGSFKDEEEDGLGGEVELVDATVREDGAWLEPLAKTVVHEPAVMQAAEFTERAIGAVSARDTPERTSQGMASLGTPSRDIPGATLDAGLQPPPSNQVEAPQALPSSPLSTSFRRDVSLTHVFDSYDDPRLAEAIVAKLESSSYNLLTRPLDTNFGYQNGHGSSHHGGAREEDVVEVVEMTQANSASSQSVVVSVGL